MSESMTLLQSGSVLMFLAYATVEGRANPSAPTWGHVDVQGPCCCWDQTNLSGLYCHPGPWWHQCQAPVWVHGPTASRVCDDVRGSCYYWRPWEIWPPWPGCLRTNLASQGPLQWENWPSLLLRELAPKVWGGKALMALRELHTHIPATANVCRRACPCLCHASREAGPDPEAWGWGWQ